MCGAEGAFFNDTYLLNTATWRWHALAAVGSPPAARHAHVCAVAAGRTLIHGGSNAAQSFDGVIAAATDFGRELSGCAPPRRPSDKRSVCDCVAARYSQSPLILASRHCTPLLHYLYIHWCAAVAAS